MKWTKLFPFFFPALIVVLGLIIYKVLGYEPNFYTIIINIGVAYLLAPKVKTFETQSGKKEQVTWLFFKKSKIISE
jgi:uncharacterized membrane protein